MCLGIPGRLITIYREHELLMGKIDFGGVVKAACLETIPEPEIGAYVLVPVGFALAKINEQEARQIFTFLDGMNELSELELPHASASSDND